MILKLIYKEIQKTEVDAAGDVISGAITGLPLAGKAVAELLTTGIDYTFDTNYTKKLDDLTDEFLDYTGEPETLSWSNYTTWYTVCFTSWDNK